MIDFNRFGSITASVVSAILRVEGETRSRKWAWRVITGREKERPANWDQQRGLNHEEDAIAYAEAELCTLARAGRYIVHPRISWLGASPDGFVMEDVLLYVKQDEIAVYEAYLKKEIPVEAKCPRLLHVEVPPIYYAQIQIQLECCDVPHGYFVSWVENSDAQFVKKVMRDAAWWDAAFPVLEQFYTDYVLADVEPPKSKRRKKDAV